MKKLLNALFAFAIFGSIFTACKDNTTTEPVAEKGLLDSTKVLNLNTYVTGTADTIKLYSLLNHKEIPITEMNTANWDIAFWRTTIWTNSGSVRSTGQGGGFVMRGTDFSLLKEVPADSLFAVETATTKAIPTGSGKGWYNYNGATYEISPIQGNLLIIKTADGKHYAKVQILSYYKGYPDSIPSDVTLRTDKTYSFKYSVQTVENSKSFLKQ